MTMRKDPAAENDPLRLDWPRYARTQCPLMTQSGHHWLSPLKHTVAWSPKKPEAASVGGLVDYLDLLLGIIAIPAVCSRSAEGCGSATQPFCRDASPAA